MHHRHDTLARLVCDLLPLAIGCGNCRGAGQLHAEGFGQRVHGRGRAHRVAVSGGGRRGRGQLDEPLIIELASGQQLAGFPDDRASTGALALVPAVEHRADREGNRGNVDCGRGHQTGGRCLVAADREDDAVERVAVQHFDQPQIGQVAIETGGRSFAGLLNGMHGKLDRNAAGFADAFADPLRQHQVVAIAGREVGAGLGDADDRLAGLQLGDGQTVIQVALEIKSGQVRAGRIVEPGARAQTACGHFLCPRFLRDDSMRRTPMSMTFNMAAAAATSSRASIASTIAAWLLEVIS